MRAQFTPPNLSGVVLFAFVLKSHGKLRPVPVYLWLGKCSCAQYFCLALMHDISN